MLMPFCVPALAANTSGSISVEMINKADKKPMVGKTVNSIKVADGTYENGKATFTLTEDFASTDVDLKATDAAGSLSAAAKSAGIKGQSATSGKDGKVSFSNCPLGAYLISSPDDIFNPFLVFIPMDEGDSYSFNVSAQPKIDIPAEENPTEEKPTEPTTQEEETTTKPEPTTGKGGSSLIVPSVTPGSQSGGGSSFTPKPHIDTPDMSGKKTETTEQATPEKLPQTGMLQYPVPVLGIIGMLLFATGFVIYGEGKKKQRKN